MNFYTIFSLNTTEGLSMYTIFSTIFSTGRSMIFQIVIGTFIYLTRSTKMGYLFLISSSFSSLIAVTMEEWSLVFEGFSSSRSINSWFCASYFLMHFSLPKQPQQYESTCSFTFNRSPLLCLESITTFCCQFCRLMQDFSSSISDCSEVITSLCFSITLLK